LIDSTGIDKIQLGRTVNLLSQIRRPEEDPGACVASVHAPWCESEIEREGSLLRCLWGTEMLFHFFPSDA
jgi:hypothetical protein